MAGFKGYHLPFRSSVTKTPLFIVRFGKLGRLLDRDSFGRGVFWYNDAGEPHEDCPWGPLENYDPLEAIAAGEWKEGLTPAEQKSADAFRAAVTDHLGDNPMFGLF